MYTSPVTARQEHQELQDDVLRDHGRGIALLKSEVCDLGRQFRPSTRQFLRSRLHTLKLHKRHLDVQGTFRYLHLFTTLKYQR